MAERPSKSRAAVRFIGSLIPVYLDHSQGEQVTAICLERGVRIDAIDEEEGEDAWVRMTPAAMSHESTEIPASFVAGLALLRYVEIAGVAMVEQERLRLLHDLVHHFRIKAGFYPYLPHFPDPENPSRQIAERFAGWGTTLLAGSLIKPL